MAHRLSVPTAALTRYDNDRSPLLAVAFVYTPLGMLHSGAPVDLLGDDSDLSISLEGQRTFQAMLGLHRPHCNQNDDVERRVVSRTPGIT